MNTITIILLILAIVIMVAKKRRTREYHVVLKKGSEEVCVGHVTSELPISIESRNGFDITLIPYRKEADNGTQK